AREHERVVAVEVGDDELVVDDLARTAAPFCSERRRDLVRKIREGDKRRVGGVAGFLHLEGSVESLRSAERVEFRARRQCPNGVEKGPGPPPVLPIREQQ